MSSMIFEFDNEIKGSAKIKVLGVGGGGCNALDSMIDFGVKGVEFIALNTDAQALEHSKADIRIQIGKETTKGLGAGADPDIGKKAMEESREQVTNVLSDADMVFIAAGMGGGTGTGAAGVISEIANELGALTVAIVTKPFKFEGNKRMNNAGEGLKKLKDHVDALIIINNQRLLQSASDSNTTIKNAFLQVDQVLYKAVRGISDLITVRGDINLDFADIKTVMKGMGDAMMGVGEASGEHACVEAAQTAIQSTLLENIDIKGAKGILVNISSSENMSLFEIEQAMEIIYDAAGSNEANVIFGVVTEEGMEDKIRVTVIATGFDSEDQPRLKTNNIIERHIFGNENKKVEEGVEEVKVKLSTVASLAPEVDYDIPAFMRNQKD